MTAVTFEQLLAAVNKANPNRDWSANGGQCQAFLWQSCHAYGTASYVYGSAKLAYLASHIDYPAKNLAPPPGACVFFDFGTYYHDGVSIGNGYFISATTAGPSEKTFYSIVKIMKITDYAKAKSCHYLGASKTNGVNGMPVITDTYGAPTPSPTQRVAGAMGARARTGLPTTASPIDETNFVAAGHLGSFDGWMYGEAVTQQGVTTSIWFRGTGHEDWYWAGGFTDVGTHDLPNLNPPPVVPAPPAVLPPYEVKSLYMDVADGQSGIDFTSQLAAGIDGFLMYAGKQGGGPISASYSTVIDRADGLSKGLRIGHIWGTGTTGTPTDGADYFIGHLHAFDVTADVLVLDNTPEQFWAPALVREWMLRVIALTGIPGHRLWLRMAAAAWADADWITLVTDLGITVAYVQLGVEPSATGVIPTPSSKPEPPTDLPIDLHEFTTVATVGNVSAATVMASPLWTADEIFAPGTVSPPTAPLPEPTPPDSGKDSGASTPPDSGEDSGNGGGSGSGSIKGPLATILASIGALVAAAIALIISALH